MSNILDATGRAAQPPVVPLIGFALRYLYPWNEPAYVGEDSEGILTLVPTLGQATIVWIRGDRDAAMKSIDELALRARNELPSDLVEKLGAGDAIDGQLVVTKSATLMNIHGKADRPQPTLVK